MHTPDGGVAQVVVVGAAPSCCNPPDATIAGLDAYIRNFIAGNPLDTLDGVREMCTDLQAHLRKVTQQTEALVLTNYQNQCGQNPRRWQVSAVGEPLGGTDFVEHEWQRGINIDCSTEECQRAFRATTELFNKAERNTAHSFETDFAGPFTHGILSVNLRASHVGGSTSILASMKPRPLPKLVLVCAQTTLNGQDVLFYKSSEGRAQKAVNFVSLAKTLALFSTDVTGRTCPVVYVLAGCNTDMLAMVVRHEAPKSVVVACRGKLDSALTAIMLREGLDIVKRIDAGDAVDQTEREGDWLQKLNDRLYECDTAAFAPEVGVDVHETRAIITDLGSGSAFGKIFVLRPGHTPPMQCNNAAREKVLTELATARLGQDASEGGLDGGGGDSRAGRIRKRQAR